MLERVFSLLRAKNPNLAVRKRHVMPPPQLVRVGTRKTMWANFAQICQLSDNTNKHHAAAMIPALSVSLLTPCPCIAVDCCFVL
jgi:translation initiation factor 2 subunit 2